MIDVIVVEGNEFSVGRSAETNALLRARSVPDRLEHHPATEHELHRFAQLARRRHRERTVRPRPKLAPETGAHKFRHDTHIFFRQSEHLRQHAAEVEDSLRLFVDR